MVRKIAILGSTGSIGKNTLKVAANLEEQVEVIALAARSNIDLLESQAKEHHPRIYPLFLTKPRL